MKNTRSLSAVERIVVWLIFCHYLVYEVVFFFWYDFAGGRLTVPVMAWKLLFPVFLIVYAGIPNPLAMRRGGAGLYLLVFAAFLLWALVSCLFSASSYAAILEWTKQFPRFLFLAGTVALVVRRPAMFPAILKLIVAWCVLAFVQYAALFLFRGFDNIYVYPGIGTEFFGPYGIFGNSVLSGFPGLSFRVARLCGFWCEPSNASASLFAAAFFARYLYLEEGRRRWKYAAFACGIAGILCLSNAGFLAFGAGLCLGLFFYRPRSWWQAAMKMSTLTIAALFAAVALFGRAYVSTHLPENAFARAVTGVRVEADPELEAGGYDPTGGRLALFKTTIAKVRERPLGVGVMPAGLEAAEPVSASAPIFWLYCTGIVGLTLLLVRESVVFHAMFTGASRSPATVALAQAWFVVLVQQSSYGSWMNPLYFIATAGVLTHVSADRPVTLPRMWTPLPVKA